MEENILEQDVQKRLILAGMRELDEHGESGFSLRRVAARSGVSCAAPYKHFKNREEFLMGIMQYVNDKWDLLFSEISRAFANDRKRCIVEAAIATVRFFTANVNYRAVIFSATSSGSPEKRAKREHILYELDRAARQYCGSKDTQREEEISFMLRALISGTILMVCGGAPADAEGTIILLKKRIASILDE